MTIAAEDASSSRAPVDVADLEAWTDYYGLTFPVLADPGETIDRLYDPRARSRPTYVLLSPGMVIEHIGGSVSDAQIERVLPTPYP